MECKCVTDKLYEYIYGEMDETICSGIREHLAECEKCRSEHDELKRLLVDEAGKLFELKEGIAVPDDLACKVRASLGIRIRLKRLKYTLAACLACVLLYTAPVFAYYAVQVFPFEKYVGFLDKDMIKDFKEGRGQVIGKSSSMNDVTLTVDGMVKRDDKYNIIFTLKVPKTKDYNYGIPVSSGMGSITVQDQFGKNYIVGSASGTVERALKEGESQYVFEISEPLSFWSYKLNVRLTAIELGYSNENVYFKKYKNVYGSWHVSFFINRSLGQR